MSENRRIRVLCVDDNADLTLLLEKQVQTQPDMESAGRVHDLDEVAEAVRRSRPHVVVLDLKMPGRDSLEVLREIQDEFPEARFIVFSGFEHDEPIEAARQAGAWGYVLKSSAPEELYAAIREVAAGKRAFPR